MYSSTEISLATKVVGLLLVLRYTSNVRLEISSLPANHLKIGNVGSLPERGPYVNREGLLTLESSKR